LTRSVSIYTITYVATIYGLTASLQNKFYGMDKRMVFFKTCPKCHGDMTSNTDRFGMYIGCLQCGFFKELTESKQPCLDPLVDDLKPSTNTGTKQKYKRNKSLV